MAGTDDPSLFNAVSPSATQLSYLLRCLSFAPKAQVKITADGLRFSAEDGSVMEGKSRQLSLYLLSTPCSCLASHLTRRSFHFSIQGALLKLHIPI